MSSVTCSRVCVCACVEAHMTWPINSIPNSNKLKKKKNMSESKNVIYIIYTAWHSSGVHTF